MVPTSRRGAGRPPATPEAREETIRQELLALLAAGPVSAREISQTLGIGEGQVAGHLEHVARSLAAAGSSLAVTPPACRSCGFVFAGRERLTRPGRCPQCHGTRVSAPRFALGRG
ncbi:MAG: transcriptional regulator [Thermodesulfobacteriota bacterium]